MQADKNLDPRYEFCAPRYHDFTSSRDDDPSNEEREKLDADEWFTLLNAGLIDTDLTTPRSRTCSSFPRPLSDLPGRTTRTGRLDCNGEQSLMPLMVPSQALGAANRHDHSASDT